MRLSHFPLRLLLFLSLSIGLAVHADCAVPESRGTLPCSYFVSPTGRDRNDGTSATTPFGTLEKAQSAMRKGNSKVVCLRAGIYKRKAALTLTAPDSGETWQYYTADGVDSAVLDGGGTLANGITIDNTSNITIDGLKIQNTTHYGIYARASAGNISGLIIKNNELANNTTAVGGAAQSVAMLVGSDVPPRGISNVTVSHNYIHDQQQGAIMVLAYYSGTFATNVSVDSNVALNCALGQSDDGVLYADAQNNIPPGDSTHGLTGVSFTNNFVRDFGGAGVVDVHGIYLDDYSSNVTVKGNIVGPKVVGGGASSTGIALIHNGQNNTFSNNIFDLGASGTEWAAVWYSDAGNPMSGNGYTNNIVLMKFAGNPTTNFGAASGIIYWQNEQPPSNYNIKNNAYVNYGGGTPNTSGQIASDASRQIYTPTQLGCTGYLYNLSAGSSAFLSPVSFVDVIAARKAGPPGFTIPTSSNHSCP